MGRIEQRRPSQKASFMFYILCLPHGWAAGLLSKGALYGGCAKGEIAAQVVKRGRGHPRAYLLPSPVGKATDPEETFRPAVCPRSKVGSPIPFAIAACGICVCVVHLADISTVHAMQQAHSDACSLHRQNGAWQVSTSTVCTD